MGLPVRAPARAENSNYAPISVGTAHISHGIVYIARCIPSLILPFLSALVLVSRLENYLRCLQRNNGSPRPVAAARERPRTNGPFQGHLRALLGLGPSQDSFAPPVPPPWHRVTGTWRVFGASVPTTPRLLWRPPSPVLPAGSCLRGDPLQASLLLPCGGPGRRHRPVQGQP